MGCSSGLFSPTLGFTGWPSTLSVVVFFPHPTNATTTIIKRTCFTPATLRLTGSGVNAVGGEAVMDLIETAVAEAYEEERV